MNRSSDVVIVGGGVAGCALAYYLALSGVKSTVIEREGVGTQASGYSAGGLNPLEGAHLPGILSKLALQSFRMHARLWDELKGDTGIDYHGHRFTLIKVAFAESELAALEDSRRLFNNASADGFEARWLDAAELKSLEPRLNPRAIRGLWAYGNAGLDSYLLTQAFARAAEKRGAVIKSGLVRGLRLATGRAQAVILEHEEIPCGQLVLAMGPWSREAEPWLDVSIPVDPLKGEILRMELPGAPLQYDFSGGGGSLHAKSDGLVWCGTTEEWKGFDREPSDSARQSILKGATNLIPDLAGAKLVKQTACLRPVTPDWLPILGRAPGWDNVHLATGAGKKGILYSPAIGKSVADLIAQGRTDLDIAACAPERFLNTPD